MEDLLNSGQCGAEFRIRFAPKADESDANLFFEQVTGTESVNFICDLMDTGIVSLETHPPDRVLDVPSLSVAPGVLVQITTA
ncbi:MAG TPA: hypothetical protein VK335_22410 [Bryobacteraceae bacterium]|nr:hypothetical protein [Bryobacteraceae bacterium]